MKVYVVERDGTYMDIVHEQCDKPYVFNTRNDAEHVADHSHGRLIELDLPIPARRKWVLLAPHELHVYQATEIASQINAGTLRVTTTNSWEQLQ